jgi:D-tyrosyl-tRNA(Tyr) deacylase
VRAVLQRVSEAAVHVEGEEVGRIGPGLLILLGVGHGDGDPEVDTLAEKVVNLRVFEDPEGKTNLSVLDVEGAALVVSQFTLFADTSKGRRPSFTAAAHPDVAAELVERFRSALEARGVPTASGRFGAGMRVSLVNDGPFTLSLDTEHLSRGRS